MILSLILSVRYRNHFPVVQFQNQVHIWNPHGTGHVFKTIWGAAGAPIFFYYRHRPMAPQFFFFFTAAEDAVQVAPKAPLPRRAREIPPKAGVSRVLSNMKFTKSIVL